MAQLEKIRVVKAYDRLIAGPSQAIQDSGLDDNGAPQSGMQSEMEIMENTGRVLPDNISP